MENETIIRLGVFLGLFLCLAILERFIPKRAFKSSQLKRWYTNWAISLANIVSLRLIAIVLPLLAIGAALNAERAEIGLMNAIELPFWVAVILTVLLFDALIWAQHVLTHRIPFLWRLHRVHHADVDMDVTTAIRFHPFEILLSMIIKIGAVYLLGPPALAVMIFEVILNGSAMFNHANIKLPRRLDQLLRLVIVTPDMHVVHHSRERSEHDRNFGFALSIWDRLFGTYQEASKKGDEIVIGLKWQDETPSRLGWSLALPFYKND